MILGDVVASLGFQGTMFYLVLFSLRVLCCCFFSRSKTWCVVFDFARVFRVVSFPSVSNKLQLLSTFSRWKCCEREILLFVCGCIMFYWFFLLHPVTFVHTSCLHSLAPTRVTRAEALDYRRVHNHIFYQSNARHLFCFLAFLDALI